jgi:UDP-N-acetyl-2-amino-2-deoxyglucuronate dehydrogenase
LHKIESEDLVCAVLHYASGATGVIQAATAIWPGYPERIEIHGTRGSAIVTGDQLTTWDVQDDSGEPAPIAQQAKSGASDPMAISLMPFERQFADFGEACKAGRPSTSSGAEGYRALQLVRSIYTSCSEGKRIAIMPAAL